MNSKLFLEAMDGIQDAYIISAQERLGYAPEREKRRVRSVRRIFTAALAAVLVLLCTLAAAMAVSPEFREAVISLFQIGEAEQVPGIPEGTNEVKQVSIGGQVSAQYVKMEGDWFVDGALLIQYGKEGFPAIRFYDLKDNTLIQVGEDAPVTSVQVRWHDRVLTTRLRWFVYDDMLYSNQIYDGLLYQDGGEIPRPSDEENLFVLTAQRLGTRTDIMLLYAEMYGTSEDAWYWVYDLETGEVRDVLAGCGIEALGFFQGAEFAEDLKHAVIRMGGSAMGTPYFVDLEQKTCTPLSELMGVDIDGNTLGSYEVTFYDSDTVLLAMAPLWRPEPTSVWAYHIPSGTVTPTVTEETGLEVITFHAETFRWPLAQKADEDGITIIDLHTGGRIKLEGLNAQDSYIIKANASGTKLLWAEWEEDRLNRLGVVDLETGVFTAFQRENMEMRFNEGVYWLGGDRVVTMMDLQTGEAYAPESLEYYLCVYEF